MLAKIQSCAVIGLEGALVEVEVDLSNGLAAFTIVGLPDAAINESRERVRSSQKNSGCLFPFKRITVNLAPADLRKEGPSYDLPIAIGILIASEQIVPGDWTGESLFLGELSLGGSLRHSNGILPMMALAAEKQVKSVFAPSADAMEAALIQGITLYPVETSVNWSLTSMASDGLSRIFRTHACSAWPIPFLTPCSGEDARPGQAFRRGVGAVGTSDPTGPGGPRTPRREETIPIVV